MTGQTVFLEAFDALDVSVRAALVFRYREDLPLGHVAKLVGRKPKEVEREIERALSALMAAGALPESAARAGSGHSAAEGELRVWLEKLGDEPSLSTFSLVLAVREEPRPRFWSRG